MIDLLLRRPATSYDGAFYRVYEARGIPGCVQEPRAPFAIAATGPRWHGGRRQPCRHLGHDRRSEQLRDDRRERGCRRRRRPDRRAGCRVPNVSGGIRPRSTDYC